MNLNIIVQDDKGKIIGTYIENYKQFVKTIKAGCFKIGFCEYKVLVRPFLKNKKYYLISTVICLNDRFAWWEKVFKNFTFCGIFLNLFSIVRKYNFLYKDKQIILNDFAMFFAWRWKKDRNSRKTAEKVLKAVKRMFNLNKEFTLDYLEVLAEALSYEAMANIHDYVNSCEEMIKSLQWSN